MARWSDVEMPTIDQLRAFVSVAEGGGFSHAGGEATPRALWQMIRRLEAKMSTEDEPIRLFADRGASLSPTGEKLLPPAKRLVAAADDWARSQLALRLEAPRITLACFPAHAALVAPSLAAWRARDRVDIDLAIDDEFRRDGGSGLIVDLRNGRYDIVIVPSDVVDPEVVDVHAEYRWALVALAPGLDSDSGKLEVSELASRRVSVCTSPRRHVSRDRLESTGVDLNVTLETESADALVTLGRSGLMVAIVPDDVVPLEADDSVLQLTHHGEPLGGVNAVVTRSGDRRPNVISLATALRRRRQHPERADTTG